MAEPAYRPRHESDRLEEELQVLQSENQVLQRAYERERERRRQAEDILENKSRELYERLQELARTNDDLVKANLLLQDQSARIDGLSSSYQQVTEDLQLAARTQLGLLPEPLDIGPVAISGIYQPAAFIAGDGYDYFLLDEHLLAFYMLDVAGHGAAAAMVSFAAHVHLNPKAGGLCQTCIKKSTGLDDAVSRTLHEINHIFLVDARCSHYFTMIYGLTDLRTGETSLGQAGHPSPVLYRRADATVQEQGDGGNPIAMFDTPSFGVASFTLRTGDRLLVYSDGATECCNSADEEFGTERLAALIEASASLTLDQTRDRLHAELTTWNGSKDFEDDLSMLLLHYRGMDVPVSIIDSLGISDYTEASFDVPCSRDGIALWEPELERQLQRLSIPDDQVFLIVLSLVELLTNIVEHGYHDSAPPGESIHVAMYVIGAEVNFIITDHAEPPPPRTIEHLTSHRSVMPSIQTPVDELPESGWGLNIITHAAASIDYQRQQDRNVLRLRFEPGEQ